MHNGKKMTKKIKHNILNMFLMSISSNQNRECGMEAQ